MKHARCNQMAFFNNELLKAVTQTKLRNIFIQKRSAYTLSRGLRCASYYTFTPHFMW